MRKTSALFLRWSKDASIDYRDNKKIFADHRGIDGSYQNNKLQSQQEHQALEAQSIIRRLAKIVADAPSQPEARDTLGRYVVKIAQKEGIMRYFAQHHPEFEKQIHQLLNAYQPIAERNRGWERDERGL